jgi:restriction system protein
MARGSGSSGSYREWEAERRRQGRSAEQARQRREGERKAQEQQRQQAEAAARGSEAAERTRHIEARVEELETLLRSSLRRDPRIRLDALRRAPDVPRLDLGVLAQPLPTPVWQPPPAPGWWQRPFGGTKRYEVASARQAAAKGSG